MGSGLRVKRLVFRVYLIVFGFREAKDLIIND